MQTSRFLFELRLHLKLGSSILIENIPDEIPRKLYPLFRLAKKGKVKLSKNYSISLGGQVTQIDPAFKMYITSGSKCPEFGAEISLLANLINFNVTMEAFEAQILSIIMQELESDVEIKQKSHRKSALE